MQWMQSWQQQQQHWQQLHRQQLWSSKNLV
jgi:hypothetical protein